MRIPFVLLGFALLAQGASFAQTPSINDLAGLQQVQQAFGKGVQIYECSPVNSVPTWIFLGPDSILYQNPPTSPNGPQQVAVNLTGPIWQWIDGSGSFGAVVQTAPSPNPNSIASLLVKTQPFGTANGVLSRVTYIVRSDSFGGTAPPANSCDTAHIGTTARVPYTSNYSFFAPAAQ